MKLIVAVVLLISVSACGGRTKPQQTEAPATQTAEAAPVTSPIDPNAVVGTDSNVPYEGPDIFKTADVTMDKTKTIVTDESGALAVPVEDVSSEIKVTTKAKEAISVKTSSVQAAKALGWLKNGNVRFTKGRLRKDGQSAKDRARLVADQKPHSVVFSCSDSRIPPEVIFDQKLGEIYVVRTEGLAVDTATIASLEKGVVSLGSQLLVVLGDDGCESSANAKKIADEIVAKSATLAERLGNGTLTIQPAVYHLKSGAVEFTK